MMALVTINNKADEQKESWSRKRVIYLFEDEEDDEDELFEIDLAVVDSLPLPRYCWDDDYSRFTAATSSALLANCLLPISQLSCAVPMAAKAGDALLLQPSTPVPVAVSGLQHHIHIEEYKEVSKYGVEQGVAEAIHRNR
ncbi:PREDICTED: uncharacterized protein LOC109155132 isoform X2 [Ipomoea nil]|uniref:uncharacterized protein LOC109155132 isoform X2 n=1 Tax=Ipomoea nil TaxID=35883 RepID=UPI0009011558|nr:PREDICTED: uncharacterized protein LOC109155132 isoform X2 [Ipomoea nil]